MEPPIRDVADLVGESVSSIWFVMDYVRIEFNGPYLTAYAAPVIATPEKTYRFPEPGSRDALCELIEQTVAFAEVDDEVGITLATTDGWRLFVPFVAEVGAYPEAGQEAAEFMGNPVPQDSVTSSLSVWTAVSPPGANLPRHD
jgi:hypothetical protein